MNGFDEQMYAYDVDERDEDQLAAIIIAADVDEDLEFVGGGKMRWIGVEGEGQMEVDESDCGRYGVG